MNVSDYFLTNVIVSIIVLFCSSNIYKASGIEHNLPKDELNCIRLKNMYSKQEVYEFCRKLSDLIKNMSKYVFIYLRVTVIIFTVMQLNDK